MKKYLPYAIIIVLFILLNPLVITLSLHDALPILERPLELVSVIFCSLPVALSLALTLTMPLASMSKVTSTCGTPRGAGGMPSRDRKSTRLNSSHPSTLYTVLCLLIKTLVISEYEKVFTLCYNYCLIYSAKPTRHHSFPTRRSSDLGEAAGAGQRDLLLLAGGLVLGADVDDAVGVNVEGHLDLRHAARRRRNAIQRSEEHTSELQSPVHFVYRLMLANKNTRN